MTKPFMDSQGKVYPKDLVKAMVYELRLQYQRNYQYGRRKAA